MSSRKVPRKQARLMHIRGSMTMSLEIILEWQEQAARGRKAEVAKPVVVEYLQGIKADVVAELERENIGVDRIATLQNRLYVLRSIADGIESDIANGKVAEKNLREAEDNGDV